MYTARLTLPENLDEAQAARLGEASAATALSRSILRQRENEPWMLQWIFSEKPHAANLNGCLLLAASLNNIPLPDHLNWRIEAVPEIDWLAHSYKQFPPFSVGPFFIYGSHYKDEIPEGQMGLQIDAATAFGSGEHGTTKGCLQIMLDLKAQGLCPWNILDMGTGSGILAIAAWTLWHSPVLAVDNDKEAVRVADHHREINHVPEGKTEMACICGDGFQTPDVQMRKPFDLIIANILAGPLKDMAGDLAEILDENGMVVLSGILHEQAGSVIKAYEAQGLRLKHHLKIDEWSSLLLQNTAA